MIPILPANMIDVLEAPFPYLIGTLPNPGLEDLELENRIQNFENKIHPTK